MSENKKPRLAEVLGVEVGEKFDIVNDCYSPYFVDADGKLFDCDNDERYSSLLNDIINHPELIKRRPRWTEQEVQDAKTFRRMWPEGEIEFDRWPDGRCCLTQIQGSLHGCLRLGEVDLFPSVKPGQTVKLADIIGGNE